MHNLEAILELAKAGMTYEQITDLLSRTSQDEPKPKEPEPKPKPKEPEPKPKPKEPEPKPKPKEPEPKPEPKEPEPKEPDNNDPEPDYKKLYEQSQKDLKAAQELNKKQNNKTQEKSEDEKLADLFTELYF